MDVYVIKKNLDTDQLACTKFKWKCILDLQMKYKTMKCVENNKKSHNPGFGNTILDKTLRAQSMKKIDKL